MVYWVILLFLRLIGFVGRWVGDVYASDSHECLVVVANLLDVHIEFCIYVGFNGAIAMTFKTGARYKASSILQAHLIIKTSRCHTAMTMASL